MAQALPFIAAGAKVAGLFINQRAQEAEYGANIDAANYNADIARRNASLTAQHTEANVKEAERQRRLILGANIAAAGGSGIMGGSALDIISDNATRSKMDVLNIQREGMLKQQNFLGQEQLYTTQARNIKPQIKISRAASVLSGVTEVAQTKFKTKDIL